MLIKNWMAKYHRFTWQPYSFYVYRLLEFYRIAEEWRGRGVEIKSGSIFWYYLHIFMSDNTQNCTGEIERERERKSSGKVEKLSIEFVKLSTTAIQLMHTYSVETFMLWRLALIVATFPKIFSLHFCIFLVFFSRKANPIWSFSSSWHLSNDAWYLRFVYNHVAHWICAVFESISALSKALVCLDQFEHVLHKTRLLTLSIVPYCEAKIYSKKNLYKIQWKYS